MHRRKTLEQFMLLDHRERMEGTAQLKSDVAVFINVLEEMTAIKMPNPYFYIKQKPSVPRLNHIDIDELKDLLQDILSSNIKYSTELYESIILIISFGLRTSEVCSIKYTHVVHGTKTLKIPSTKNHPEGRLLSFNGMLPVFKEEALEIISRSNRDMFILFSNRESDNIQASTKKLYNAIKIAKEIIKMPTNFELRDLRSTYAAMMHNAGVSNNAISNYLGHNFTTTTEKHYSRDTLATININEEMFKKHVSDKIMQHLPEQ